MWDKEEAWLNLCLLNNTKCVTVLAWWLHGLLLTMAQQHYHNTGEKDASISQLFGSISIVLPIFSFRTKFTQMSYPCKEEFFISPLLFCSALCNLCMQSIIAVNLVWVVPYRAPIIFLTLVGFFRSQLQDHEEIRPPLYVLCQKKNRERSVTCVHRLRDQCQCLRKKSLKRVITLMQM